MSKLKKWIIIGVLLVLSGSVITFFTSSFIIGTQVKNQCKIANQTYPGEGGNCVEHLIYRVNDETLSYRERNRAIWPLGQLGDPRALDTLNKYYTGVEKDSESLGQELSQWELDKAINLCEGGLNITVFIWRNKLILGQYAQ
jgi:hypothetical protein